jgi:hypothetical protein
MCAQPDNLIIRILQAGSRPMLGIIGDCSTYMFDNEFYDRHCQLSTGRQTWPSRLVIVEIVTFSMRKKTQWRCRYVVDCFNFEPTYRKISIIFILARKQKEKGNLGEIFAKTVIFR